MFTMVLLWVASGILCAYVAGQKNRDKGSWFLAGLFFGIFAVIAVVAVPTLTDEERRRRERESMPEEDPEMKEWRKQMKQSLRDIDK